MKIYKLKNDVKLKLQQMLHNYIVFFFNLKNKKNIHISYISGYFQLQ